MKKVLRIALLALCTLILLPPSFGQVVGVGISVNFAPPALPVYELPPCPGDGFLWTPGYWAWDPDYGYYWVPGTWVEAPEPGLLWTPAWWGWDNGAFLFHDGYWATDIGFYGGINYGFGYFGVGFVGGGWQGGIFRYNTAVLTVDTTVIHNTYVDRTVIVNREEDNHVSYNGGDGGTNARPTPAEARVDQERHVPPPAAQQQHFEAARNNPQMRASQNQGKPAVAATARAGDFSGRGVVEAKEAGAPYHPPANAPGAHGNAPTPEGAHPGEATPAAHEGAPAHASDLQPHQVTPPNTGNPKLDQKYQQQQQKLIDKQNQEHQQLEQKQSQDHQKAQQQNYSQQKQSQMEQKHQQQTQQMEQRHSQQMQQLQTRQAPAPKPR